MSNSIFRYEDSFKVTTIDFTTVLYLDYCKGTKWATVHFFDTDKIASVYMSYDEFMNLATRWKNWKTEMAEAASQQQIIFT